MNNFRINKTNKTGAFILKTVSSFLVLLFLVFFPIIQSQAQSAKKSKYHPRNIKLIKHGLIPPIKFFPEVPRMTAEEALSLYHSGRGFFIAIGGDSKIMDGGILLKDYMKFDPRRLKLPKGIVIVTYCG